MKLTRQQLTTIIKEELQAVLGEQEESNEEKIIGLCRNPDTTETGNISGESLGLGNCLDIAHKKFEERAGQPPGKPEEEVIRLVIKNLGFDGIFDLFSKKKLVLNNRSELEGFNPIKTYLTHQDLEAIFKMFNPPEHKREEDEDLGGVMTTFVDQSEHRVKMLSMLAKFTKKLKVQRGSSVDEVRFQEEDFGGEVPENIEFYN